MFIFKIYIHRLTVDFVNDIQYCPHRNINITRQHYHLFTLILSITTDY